MKAIAPNTLLQNRYLIVHLIGKGGMGDVYLAVDQRLGSAVALKRTFFSDDEMFGSAFEREAKTLARLRHTVLPKVSDHFTENDFQFLVMEHISGDDLAKRLEAAQKPFPLSWVLFWADQLLDALAYLHSHEPPIIHRDIKPQNLKLTDENSIILLDFGLSKNTDADTKAVLSGSTGSVVGYTPHYAPMEQIRGTGTNPRSDIYSLSATLYQLLTNVVPFDSLTRADALLNGMDDPVKPINEINPEVPATVSAVILKGMELSQDKRFQNAREMQKALREAFVQMQNSMTAQTVAFNLQNEMPLQQSNLPSSATLNVTSDASDESQLISVPANYNSATEPANLSKDQTSLPELNLVETLRMDPPLDSLPKQSSVKTEVLSPNSLPQVFQRNTVESKPGENSTEEKNYNQSKAVPATKDSEKNKKTGDEEVFSSNAASLTESRNYDSNPSNDSEVYTAPRIRKADAFATYIPASGNSQEKNSHGERFVSEPAPAAKKAAGKTSFVGGGLALLLLVLGAAGAGWFFYNNYFAVNRTENPPSTPPRIETSPSPAPTIENVFGTNAQDNSNSQVVASEANNQTNTEPENSKMAETGNSNAAQPLQPPVTSKPTQPTIVRNKPKTNPTPAAKPTAKPTDKKNDAPVILQ
jgi:serine/threonine protein kinase